MAVFVTGATGFLGVNLVRSLVSDGQQVRAMVRPNSPRIGLNTEQVEFVQGDVTDLDSIRRGMQGCDQVYHLAGWVRITSWGLKTARRVNVGGTENVCRAAVEAGVKRLVHVSSVAAVGHGPINAPATEETPWNLDVVRAPYYRTKYEAEQVVQRYVANGLDAVIVNPGYVVGPFDIKPTSGRLLIGIVTGKIKGYPARGGIGFVDVREAVDGMRSAMQRGVRGERYVLVGQNMTYKEFAYLVAQVGGVSPPKIAARYWMLYPFALGATPLDLFWPNLFGEFNLTVLRTGFCEHFVSSEKARRQLGVEPRPIEQAVADTLLWFEQNGYLQRTADGWRIPVKSKP